MTWKIYNPDNEAVFFTNIRDIMELTGATMQEARKCFYKRVVNLNGTHVMNVSDYLF